MLLYPSRVVVTGFHPHGHPGVDKYHGKNQYFLCCPSRSRVMFTRFACRRSAGQFNNTINISKNLCGIEDGKVRPEGFPMPVSVPAASMLYRCGTALFVLYPLFFLSMSRNAVSPQCQRSPRCSAGRIRTHHLVLRLLCS